MSIKIRLARTGKKNAPTFTVVVSQTRTKRNGEFLEVLGNFDPASKTGIVLNKEKMNQWVAKGATITNAVKQMIEGKYKYVKYAPKAVKEERVLETPTE